MSKGGWSTPARETGCPGVYAVGWIKRGPTGILGTNKRDAAETVSCLEEDLAAGELQRGRSRPSTRSWPSGCRTS